MIDVKEGWQVKKLGEICEFGNGLWTGKKPPFQKVGVIRNTNFTKDGKLDDTDIVYLEVEKSQFLKRKLRYGDIILEKSGGGPKQPVGRVIIFDKEQGDFSFSNFTSMIRIVNSAKVDFSYLHRFLFFSYISGATEKMQSHSTGIRNLKFDDYKDIYIPLPPLPEQQHIVSILDETFAAITQAKANAEQNLKNAKELFESYLQGVFEKKGEGWESMQLGKIATFRNGMNFTKGSKGELIKIVGVRDFQKSFWAPLEKLESVTIDGKLNEIDFLKQDDILAVRSNGNPELIGRTLLAGNVIGKVSHSGFTIRIRLDANVVSPLYLCHYLKTSKARKELVESGTGVNIKSLNQGALSSLLISFPKSIDEQQIIVQKLDILSIETKKLEAIYQKKISDLEELKKSLLEKAFKGELTDKLVEVLE